MSTPKSWYAVYTRPKWERKVADLLSRKRIENYCPLHKSVRQWSDRKKIIYEPLFTSYVFVQVNEIDQLAVRQTDGVLNFVYWLGKPAVVRNEEIDDIRNFLLTNEHIRLERIELNVNDRVRVLDGAFRQMEGNVTELRSKSVKVILPSLGYALVAEIPKSRVEVINVNPHSYARYSAV